MTLASSAGRRRRPADGEAADARDGARGLRRARLHLPRRARSSRSTSTRRPSATRSSRGSARDGRRRDVRPAERETGSTSRRARGTRPRSSARRRSCPSTGRCGEQGGVMALTRVGTRDLIRRYEEGPAKLRAALANACPPEARKWRPAEGKWSAHEVVCHTADSETNASRGSASSPPRQTPTILGYDQAAGRGRSTTTPRRSTALATVEAVRANTAELLRRLPDTPGRRRDAHANPAASAADDWLNDLRRAPREALPPDRAQPGGLEGDARPRFGERG